MTAGGNDTVRDLVQVGAMFGLIAGLGAFVLVLAWVAISRLWQPALPLGATVRLHLVYVLIYVAIGAAVGVLWPTRTAFTGRMATCVLAVAAGALTIFSVSAGPAWRWSPTLWSRYALAVVLFAAVFAWPARGNRE